MSRLSRASALLLPGKLCRTIASRFFMPLVASVRVGGAHALEDMLTDQTICIDFDGVIHSYITPFTRADLIPDPPVEGAFQFLDLVCRSGYRVVIFTSRVHAQVGDPRAAEAAIRRWLRDHRFGSADSIAITALKIPAAIYIDDRGHRFTGRFPSLTELTSFRPWNRQGNRPAIVYLSGAHGCEASWLCREIEGLGLACAPQAAEAAPERNGRRSWVADLEVLSRASLFAVFMDAGGRDQGERDLEIGFALALATRLPPLRIVAVGARRAGPYLHPAISWAAGPQELLEIIAGGHLQSERK